MVWDSYFTGEDEKNEWIKTLEEIRKLPPWKFKEEKYSMLRSSLGSMYPYAKKAYKLFEMVEKERNDIVDTNIFDVFGDVPKIRPYYSTGHFV